MASISLCEKIYLSGFTVSILRHFATLALYMPIGKQRRHGGYRPHYASDYYSMTRLTAGHFCVGINVTYY